MTWCWHAWVRTEDKVITFPKLGPFDPRTDEARTEKVNYKICAKCGKEEEYVYDPQH